MHLNEVIGFEIDLAKALCTRLEMTCDFVVQDWAGIIPALQNNKYDVIMAGMTVTSKRREVIDFSRGYADTGVAFASTITKKTQSIADLKKSLKGKKNWCSNWVRLQHNMYKKHLIHQIVRAYSTQDELNIDLLSGRIHAAANDTSAWYDLQKTDI